MLLDVKGRVIVPMSILANPKYDERNNANTYDAACTNRNNYGNYNDNDILSQRKNPYKRKS